MIFGQNRSVGATSMKIVMSSVPGSCDKKTVIASEILNWRPFSKMATICFFKLYLFSYKLIGLSD